MGQSRRIVLVGHCGPDVFMLKSAVGRVVPEASIDVVNDAGMLAPLLTSESVLLVNRVLDGHFETTSGVDLIGTVTQRDDPPVSILVSNYPEAQEAAMAAGARPGFGKSDLYDPKTAELLTEAVRAA